MIYDLDNDLGSLLIERENLIGFIHGYVSDALGSKLSNEIRFELIGQMIYNSFNIYDEDIFYLSLFYSPD